jgi:hypothetical protein
MALARHVGQRIVARSADGHDDEDGLSHSHGAKVCSGAMVSRRHAPPSKRTRMTLGP